MFEKSRLHFFCKHLALSVLVSGFILGWVFFVWYPAPLAKALGAVNILWMVIIVDIILGPLLGFLVYKKGKKTLKIDLAVIIFFQCLAMAYGVYSLEKTRPVWVVYTGNNFDLVRKNEIIDDKGGAVAAQFKKVSWFKPQFVAAEYSRDDEKKYSEMFREMNQGYSRAQMPAFYKTLDTAESEIVRKSKDLNDLNGLNDKDKIKDALKNNMKADAWLPLKTYNIDMVVLINRKEKQIVNIVDLRPE